MQERDVFIFSREIKTDRMRTLRSEALHGRASDPKLQPPHAFDVEQGGSTAAACNKFSSVLSHKNRQYILMEELHRKAMGRGWFKKRLRKSYSNRLTQYYLVKEHSGTVYAFRIRCNTNK